MKTNVSVICTVLNEGKSLDKLLISLTRQTYPPDEIVVVDGGSTDNTVTLLKNFADTHHLPLNVIESPGANISRGRNIAIQAASHPIIASTDAGVRLDDHWLEELIKPFKNSPAPAVVSGFFIPDSHSAFEVAMGATVLPQAADINPA